MSLAVLQREQARVRRRRAAIALALLLPPALALAWLAQRHLGAGVVVAIAAAVSYAWWLLQERRCDLRSYLRRLNSADARFDDSAELLLADAATLTPLAQLQQQRLLARVADGLPDLRPAWPRRALAGSLALAGVLLVLSLWSPPAAPPAPAVTTPAAAAATAVRLTAATVTVTPPRYTGLPASRSEDLGLRVPAGAQLQWQLQLQPPPRAARLRFHDGRSLELVRDGDSWSAQARQDEAALYRLEIDADLPLQDERRYRLDVIADTPPQIRVDAPDRTLSLREPGQSGWDFDIQASDDYGLGEASLEIVRAQGSGENIQVKRDTVRLRGAGDAREQRYRHRIHLDALALEPGDEVIVRFDVADRRDPEAQHSRSASYILRLPPPQADDGAGMEGLMRTALPAFFRSQRQLIIDTEALIAERPKLSEDGFVAKSDALGVEQKILRLRYGQFLGEEFESGRGAAHAAPAAGDGHADKDGADKAAEAPGEDHDHDHAAAAAPQRFGDAGNVLAEFGHTHDHTEAATLLDPQTKRILKAALEQMWQAELQLRTGKPQQALPYENKALEQIKLVQQASRIYLARVGLELPPVDETRRLSGERKDLRDSASAAVAATPADADLDAVWQSLRTGVAPDWERWDAWQRRRGATAADALDLAAAADNLRRDPACAACRAELRDRLWPLLPRASAASAGRAVPDAAGRAYLDALRATETPP
ncbi:MAG: hypothetical protein BGP24_11555 [Lysobacterales bacterium 69-70]|nr:hypothetical protein [Xanthomonadaceae bacterium]ODU30851.1 MAG: hypothetical protein ABS97_21320 [Xanthomonadaceae bacterium SCN 69-320]ODV22179.1 MAG: hypothetical protein ABT27_02700 [Xanthomonadaceae bacterium SCN 69-25]OJY98440.1 MAG: hypothetical protein BGP24_11555 [Xanthomonadales bacterium 69-70]